MNDDWSSMNNFESGLGMQESSGHGRAPQAKADRTRRSWSVREEEVLILCLNDLVINEWKSDNGFRPGYTRIVEDTLKREFPNSDLKISPHVNSKIFQWKKSYYCLAGILERSGVGFNSNGNHKIDCDNDQWEQIIKADGNARFMRNRSWPMWEDWKFVFGKDRATGGTSEDNQDSFDHFISKTNVNNSAGGVDANAGLEDHSTTNPLPRQVLIETPDESNGQSIDASQQAKKTGKKRKANYDSTSLIEVLTKMQDDTNIRPDKLTGRIGYDFDVT